MQTEQSQTLTMFQLPGSVELDEFQDDHTVFAYRKETVTWGVFRQRVFNWMRTLSDANDAANSTDGMVAVYHHDVAEFLAILFAVWRLGRQAVVVPNTLGTTLARLETIAPVWAGEFPANAQALRISKALSCSDSEMAALADKVALDSNAVVLRVFTSGSSGDPELIPKSFAQIAAEAAMLQSVWGHEVANQQSVASVSHLHMYGLSFHVFWPFLFGRTIYAEELIYLESLPEALKLASSVLITSPAHLAALPESVEWAQWHSSLTKVFCAGAPLLPAAATNCTEELSVAPTEIYGSTEAGAVAWRYQHIDPHWQTLPGIRCRLDGECLSLRSPALAHDDWDKTADKAVLFSDQQFELLGRVDKIVKLAGKRVSLTGVERQLAGHPWVTSSKVLPHTTKTNRLCAVVQLDAAGLGVLIDQKDGFVKKALRNHLADHVERLAIPRYWRFVRSMPVNAQGKTSQQELQALFSHQDLVSHGKELHRERDETGSTVTITLQVPDNLKYFQGHFPAQPVLAGVVQIHWAVEYGIVEFGLAADQFLGMEAVKFQRVIVPGAVLQLTLNFDARSLKLHFRYTDQERICSSGRVIFQEKASGQ